MKLRGTYPPGWMLSYSLESFKFYRRDDQFVPKLAGYLFAFNNENLKESILVSELMFLYKACELDTDKFANIAFIYFLLLKEIYPQYDIIRAVIKSYDFFDINSLTKSDLKLASNLKRAYICYHLFYGNITKAFGNDLWR